MFLTFLIALSVTRYSLACLSMGAPPCCCGGCGHRARARGAKTLTDENSVQNHYFEEGTGLTAWNYVNRTSTETADQLFHQCCLERKLPAGCLNKCHFGTFNRETLQRMLFGLNSCPIQSAAEMQYCAAQGRDHSQCCESAGIGSTAAGQKCLIFCDQTPGRVTPLDFSYLPCFDRFEQMKQCFSFGISKALLSRKQLHTQKLIFP